MPVHSGSPQPIPQGENVPQAPPEDVQKVSNHKVQGSVKRVHLNHAEANLNSEKLDCSSAPTELKRSPCHDVHETKGRSKPLTMRLKPLKLSTLEKAPPITWPSPSFSVCTKAREQSNKTILDRELPKGSSLIDKTPNNNIR